MSLGDKFNVRAGNYVGVRHYGNLYVMRTETIDNDNGMWMIEGNGVNGPFYWKQRYDGGELEFILLAEDVGNLSNLLAAAEYEVVTTARILRKADDKAMLYSHDDMSSAERYEAAAAEADEAWMVHEAAKRYRNFLLAVRQGVEGRW